MTISRNGTIRLYHRVPEIRRLFRAQPLAERLSLLERECLYKRLLITSKGEMLWMIS